MLRLLAILSLGALIVSGCGAAPSDAGVLARTETVDVRQVIVGRPFTPQIMLVVDASEAMLAANDGGGPGTCLDGDGGYVGRGGDCKWNHLLDVVLGSTDGGDLGFLGLVDQIFAGNAVLGDSVAFGLTVFGAAPETCAPGRVLNPVLPLNEGLIRESLLALTPGGGAPLAETLLQMRSTFPTEPPTLEFERLNDLFVFTEGTANCDAAFPATAASCSDDRCTLGACPTSTWGTEACACFDLALGQGRPTGCLDEDAAVQATSIRYNEGIRTSVMGFEPSSSTSAIVETLERLGDTGNGGDGDASPSSYDDAYLPADVEDLLNPLFGVLWVEQASFTFDVVPPAGASLEVFVTLPTGPTVQLDPAEFSYDPSVDTLRIIDSAIEEAILGSIPSHPAIVDIRWVQAL